MLCYFVLKEAEKSLRWETVFPVEWFDFTIYSVF